MMLIICHESASPWAKPAAGSEKGNYHGLYRTIENLILRITSHQCRRGAAVLRGRVHATCHAVRIVFVWAKAGWLQVRIRKRGADTLPDGGGLVFRLCAHIAYPGFLHGTLVQCTIAT
jgi:hypothetical protein